MKKSFLGTSFFFFLFLSTFMVAQTEQNTYTISELKDEYFLNDKLEVRSFSKSEEPKLEDLIHLDGFKPYKEATTDSQFLHRDTIHWGKITLINDLEELNELRDWKLFIGNGNFIDVYVVDTSDNILDGPLYTGNLKPQSQKNLQYANRQARVNLSLKGHAPLTLFIRITGRNHNPTTFHLSLNKYDFNESWWFFTTMRAYWMFLGFLVTMVLFNYLMYWGTKDKAFSFHALFLFGVTIYLFEFFAIMEDAPFFKEHPFYIQQCTYIMLTLLDYGYLQFVRTYMNLDKLLPKWDRVFKGMIVARFLFMVFTILTFQITQNEPLTDKFTAVYMISEYLFLLFFMTILFKTGDSKTWYLAVGTLLIVLGVILSAWAILFGGIIKIPFVQIGVMGEILFFSLGLAHRMKLLLGEELEAQRLKDLNEFKAKFYTNITHEFRTPLTVIKGMSSELEENTEALSISEKVKKDLRGKLELIKRNGQNLLNLVNRILDLAKLESGHMQLDLKKGDILAYLRYLTDSFHSFAKSKNIHLQFLTEIDALEMTYDSEKVQLILTNLISNALKFSSQGDRVSVLVKTDTHSGTGIEQLFLSVKDTGMGIEPEQLEYIFERFYQADNAAKKAGEGTGIGLALTKELVNLMKGRIEVKSEVGKGTEFQIWLPINRSIIQQKLEESTRVLQKPNPELEVIPISPAVEPNLKDSSIVTTVASQGTGERSTILIVEDSPDIVQYLKTLLEKDYEILTAYNGAMGIQTALEHIPDIIISDVMMPEKDGFEVCETLKNDEKTSHIPIILLTAKATVEDRIAGLSRGADAYLAKPFEKEELFIRLEKLIELRKELQKRYAHPSIESGTNNAQAENQEDEFILKLKTLINDNLSDATFGIPHICRGMAMSRAQLHRKITALTGRSTSIYVRAIRLNHARNLLLTTDLTISEIAYDVGFSDPNYFSRTYAEEFDETPSETRK